MNNIYKNVSQFSQSYSPSSSHHCQAHPQHRYFKLYDKYTSQANVFVQQQPKPQQHYVMNGRNYDETPESKIKELQMQNQKLREELANRKDQINKLKYELYYCNQQLQHITSVEANQYQNAINELRIQIQAMLQKDKQTQSQLGKLQTIQQINTPKPCLPHIKCQQSSKQYLNYQVESIDKQNEHSFANVGQQYKRQQQTNRQFVNGLKDMYAKIMGSNTKSLKQLWKWLKDMAQTLNRLRKWSKKSRQFVKSSLIINTCNIMGLLDEAMIIIN